MPIQIACPECGKRYRFPDERAGATVECKECGAEIDLPGGSRRKSRARDDDDMPSPSGRRRSRKTGRSSKSSGAPVGIIIAACLGGLVVVGLVVVMLVRRPAANNVPPVAGNPSAPNSVAPGAPNVPGSPAPAGTAANPGTAATKTATSVAKGWKATVDPSATPALATQLPSFQIETKAQYGLNANCLLYPNAYSPFVLIGDPSSSSKQPRELWNLFTGSKVRDVAPFKQGSSDVGFSPDGKLVAWYRYENGGGLDVYDIETEKLVAAIPLPSGQVNVTTVSLPSSQRLVIGSTVHRKLMTWKLPSGEAEHDISLGDKAQPNELLTFSPGGRFVAFTGDFLSHALHLYDLNTGEQAGAIEFPERMTNQALTGLAFSPDGTELAAVFGMNHGATSDRIVIWNAANGASVADFLLPEPDQRPVESAAGRTSLQWFPDRKRLLQNGRHLIDREARRVVFSLSRPSLAFDTDIVRHVISANGIAAWEGSKEAATLAPMELNESEIARAREIAASGGLMIDARLPKLTSFNRKSASDKSTMDATWKVQPDPCADPSPLAAPPSLQDANGRVRELVLSRLDSPHAAVRLATGEDATKAVIGGIYPRYVTVEGPGRSRSRQILDPVACRQNSVEVLDLAKGESTGRVEIPFPCELIALSPSGSRALVAAMEGQGRLDLFSIPEGKHLAGCRPFGDETKPEHRDVHSAVFLDDETVAACSSNDRLVVFKLPTCSAVYAVQDAGALALSPGGKLLATCAEGTIEFRDAKTGDGRGSAQLVGNAVAMSFSSGGDRLAVLTSSDSGSQVNVIELKDGAVSTLTIPAAQGPLLWVGEDQLLAGGDKASELIIRKTGNSIDRHLMLINLRRQAVLWSYEYGTGDRVALGHATFDNRLWVAGAPKRGAGSKVTAVALPEPSIATRLTDKALDAQLVVKPGTTVTLEFALTDPPDYAGFSAEVRKVIDAAVRNNGLTPQDGQPIKLSVTATVANVPGTIKLQLMGLGVASATQPSVVDIQPKKVTIRVAYEQQSRTLWESKQEISNASFGLVRIEGKLPQQAIDEQMWKQAAAAYRRSQPPSHVLAGATNKGLGTSRLAGDGVHPPD